jgi:hypothetical protein
MILQGKGMYLWIIRRVEGGDPNAIAEAAKQAGLSHVLIKVADGRGTYNTFKMQDGKEYHNAQDGVDFVPAMVAALRARGIQPWGWQYIYGRDAVAEARMAIQRVKQFNLDGFVVNAEVEFKEKGMDIPARRYMQELRAGLPNTPIGFSSFRYPSYHRPLPFEVFLEYSDINMPQVYWVGGNNPAAQLLKSLREYQSLRVWRPLLPTGAAYAEHGWTATPDQVASFINAAKEYGLPGVNFWEWYYARRNSAALWNPIQRADWAAGPSKPVDVSIRYIEALNSNDPVKIASLYSANGVHVNAARTLQGPQAILGWYHSLLRDTLPNGRFEITGSTQSDNIRTLTWTAQTSSGRVLDGKDSLGVQNNQIAYHYSYFTVQPN